MTKVLIISSLQSTRCGVGAYAHEQRLALRRAGRIVRTLSPDRTSAASVQCGFRTLRGLLAAMRYACLRRWDEVHMHLTDALMMPRPASRATFVPTRLLQAALPGLLGLRFGARFHLVCHENALARRPSLAWRLARSVAYWPQRAIEFHSARNRAAFLDYFGAWVDERHTRIVDPGRFMVPRFSGGRAAARARVIFSSSVAARARLLDTPILYRDLPNLRSQLDRAVGATPFRDSADLATRLAQLAPKAASPPGPAPADEGRAGSGPRRQPRIH